MRYPRLHRCQLRSASHHSSHLVSSAMLFLSQITSGPGSAWTAQVSSALWPAPPSTRRWTARTWGAYSTCSRIWRYGELLDSIDVKRNKKVTRLFYCYNETAVVTLCAHFVGCWLAHPVVCSAHVDPAGSPGHAVQGEHTPLNISGQYLPPDKVVIMLPCWSDCA